MPYYFYDLKLLAETLDIVASNILKNNFKVHYAIKANNNNKILNFISKRGFDATCVNGSEIMWALGSGFNTSEIVFAGVAKSDEELEYALLNNVGMIHCESLEKIIVINELFRPALYVLIIR